MNNGTISFDKNISFLELRSFYATIVKELSDDQKEKITLRFDACRKEFRAKWDKLWEEIENKPHRALEGVVTLIMSQQHIVALILAICRLNSNTHFASFKKFLEFISETSADKAGHIIINTVPCVQAGFLYMLACVTSYHFESWAFLSSLLREQFAWFHFSSRPLYDFGFNHPQFFHSEALNRKASVHHDLFRHLFSQVDMLDVLMVNKEKLIDIYTQTQMILSLRGAQEYQNGNLVLMFADFGRFYESRIQPLFTRIKNERDFALSLSKIFDEEPEQWLRQLTNRFEIIHSNFWGSTNYLWQSLRSYDFDRIK